MFDPYTPISFPMLSFPRPCHHLYYPPNFVLHILPLSFSHPPSSPFLRFSPEWRVLRHCRACIASLFQARAPRLLFPRLPHRLLLRVLPSSSLSPPCFIHHFRRGRLVVSTRETPPSFFFSSPPPSFLFRFTLSPSPHVHRRTGRRPVLLHYEFFHPRRARVSLSPSHQPPPRHGASLKMERRGWLRLCRRRTRRDGWLRDGQSIFFFYFVSFFFLKISFIANWELLFLGKSIFAWRSILVGFQWVVF